MTYDSKIPPHMAVLIGYGLGMLTFALLHYANASLLGTHCG